MNNFINFFIYYYVFRIFKVNCLVWTEFCQKRILWLKPKYEQSKKRSGCQIITKRERRLLLERCEINDFVSISSGTFQHYTGCIKQITGNWFELYKLTKLYLTKSHAGSILKIYLIYISYKWYARISSLEFKSQILSKYLIISKLFTLLYKFKHFNKIRNSPSKINGSGHYS